MKAFIFCLATLLVCFALLATDVSGFQSGTWSLANSPYNLVGDVTIAGSQVLTIEPGVVVYARGNFRINAEGSIQAYGSPADSIRFVSGQDDPNALWTGIRLESGSMHSTFAYCYFEKATNGINSIASPVTIQDCRFNLNEKGIHIYGIGVVNPPRVTVSNCIIEHSIQNGIMIAQNSNAHIHHNELRYNGTGAQYYGAIQLSNQSPSGANNPLINNNHIHHNHKQGITAWDIVGAQAITPHIHHNTIEYNLTGIYLLNAGGYVEANIIRHNFISGNADSGAGVMVAGATSEPYFERNEIYGNFTGFYLGSNAKPVLGNLDTQHSWAQGENRIYDNIDESNLLHSVFCYSYTDASIVIKAENNYWGTNDPDIIDLGIRDQLDSPSLPLVDYDPWQWFTQVTGTLEYEGSETLEDFQIEIVGFESKLPVHNFDVSPGLEFELEFEIDEPFYVVGKARIQNSGKLLYTSPGYVYNPTIFQPYLLNSFSPITFPNYSPESYFSSGTPYIESGRTIYPVYHNFWIYHWDYINAFYEEEDFRYLKSHTRFHPDGNLEFELSDGMIWDKFQNRQAGDTWQRWEVTDDLGTLRNSIIHYYELDDGDVQYHRTTKLLTQIDLATGKVISQMEYMMYQEGWLSNFDSDANLDSWMLVSGDFFTSPLAEGDITQFTIQTNCYQPFHIRYDPIQYAENGVLELHWQPPAKDYIHSWTHYRIYDNDQLMAVIDYELPFYSAPISNSQSHLIKIRAYDGNEESDPSGILYLPITAADDLIASPMMLKVYPNPFSSKLFIELETDKSIAGEMSIYNLRGQRIRSQSFDTKDGKNQLSWDGRDSQGNSCAKGIYFIRINNPGQSAITKRIVKL